MYRQSVIPLLEKIMILAPSLLNFRTFEVAVVGGF